MLKVIVRQTAARETKSDFKIKTRVARVGAHEIKRGLQGPRFIVTSYFGGNPLALAFAARNNW